MDTPKRRPLLRLALALAVLACVPLVAAWLVGSALPAAHQVRVGVTLKQGPSAVWEQLTDWQAQGDWRSDVVSVEALDPVGDRPAWRLHHRSGGHTEVAILAWAPPRSYTLRVDGPRFSGTRSVQLVRAGLGTGVVLSERGEIDRPLARLRARQTGVAAPARRLLSDLATSLGERAEVLTEPTDVASLGR